ncbi:MAG: hypothetical protein AAF152_00945 [Cyanobacteria bacterium P01_A01_bin.114]
MDVRQDSAPQLSDRVDVLYSMLEQINEKVTTLLSKQDESENMGGQPLGISPLAVNRAHLVSNEALEHKDILNDEPRFDSDHLGYDQALSPEIQIQRLTAQLTAAYNRIAALEEQLLASRAY